MFSSRTGFMSLMKEGGKHYSGLEEATYRSIDACKKFACITRTSLGPNSMNKLILNHIDKMFVTSDAATIIEQLEIQHPAAKMIAMASKMQEQEFGDATNLVVVIAGELLSMAELLLRQGLHVADVVKGFSLGLEQLLRVIPDLVCFKVNDVKSVDEIQKVVAVSVGSKTGFAPCEVLSALVCKAVVSVLPPNPLHLNLDNVRVAKLVGGCLSDSFIINGILVSREVHGSVSHKENCKVLLLGCGLEIASTETKGTVLLENAEQLLNFSKGEESRMENTIKSIADAGVEAIIVGGAISDLGQHFCNKYNILTLKCQSKYELQRICRTLGATTLIKLAVPSKEDVGYAESISVEEIASKHVTIIKGKDSKVSTIVLRGATLNFLDEIERTIDDGVRCIKNVTKDSRFVAGGGACEIELAQQIQAYGAKVSGLEQYAVVKYGEALESVARILAENAGRNHTEALTQLYAAHKAGNKNIGIDVEAEKGVAVADMLLNRTYPIVDHYKTKECAIKLATDAALTVLKVDQIIMARPAGGPKPPEQSGNWDED